MANGTYNANADVLALSTAVAMDADLKGAIYSRILDEASTQHNAFEQMTSVVDSKGMVGSVRSIFAKKSDLSAGGSSNVIFTVIGTPGGPGVIGNDELTGNTSQSLLATYGIPVGWVRDAFELDRETIEFLSAGRSLVETTTGLLAKKMGILKQNHMMIRLILAADGNVYRPNNRQSTDALTADDTLSPESVISARARLSTGGGKPIAQKLGKTGYPIKGFLTFGTDTAMLGLRNDDSYTAAITAAGVRGDENPNFSGTLVDWQGIPFYEFPVVDEAWDDYIGNPMLPKAKVAVAFNAASAVGACVLKGSATNTKSRYFQWFKGYDFKFIKTQDAVVDAAQHYAWACNPDGTVAFIGYIGSGNVGNSITVNKILSAAAGVSTLGVTTVGNVTLGAGGGLAVDAGTRVLTKGVGGNIPTAWDGKVVDAVKVGAILIQANANGNQIGYTFMFGSMAACYATGRIAMAGIEQERDYGFALGKGFEMIFGTGVTKNPYKKPAGYQLVEHVLTNEGYLTPSVA